MSRVAPAAVALLALASSSLSFSVASGSSEFVGSAGSVHRAAQSAGLPARRRILLCPPLAVRSCNSPSQPAGPKDGCGARYPSELRTVPNPCRGNECACMPLYGCPVRMRANETTVEQRARTHRARLSPGCNSFCPAGSRGDPGKSIHPNLNILCDPAASSVREATYSKALHTSTAIPPCSWEVHLVGSDFELLCKTGNWGQSLRLHDSIGQSSLRAVDIRLRRQHVAWHTCEVLGTGFGPVFALLSVNDTDPITSEHCGKNAVGQSCRLSLMCCFTLHLCLFPGIDQP